ncbi:hypothetical protein [Actinoplanes sp. CA-252034]|uniref:hypothetical protein n=1 Tax=Actinoplanes sp. CA-252034 TaxID=3239906 RepID=UPI003D98B7B3
MGRRQRLAHRGRGSDLRRRRLRFLSDDACKRYREIVAHRDPDGRFCGYPGGAWPV